MCDKVFMNHDTAWFITQFLFPFAVKQDWTCRSPFANKSNKTFLLFLILLYLLKIIEKIFNNNNNNNNKSFNSCTNSRKVFMENLTPLNR